MQMKFPHWCIALLLLFFAGTAHAQDQNRFAKLQLLTGTTATVEGSDQHPLMMGIDVMLAQGWKVYWRTPGDAGQPLTIDWKQSTNISDMKMEWPVPTRYVEEFGLEVFGYKDEVVFPLEVTRADPTQAAHVKLMLHYAVCSDICVPYDDVLEEDIPATLSPVREEVAKIAAFSAMVPKQNGTYGYTIAEVAREEESKDKGVLRVVADSATRRFALPDVFVDSSETGFRFPKPRVHISNGGKHAEFRFDYEITLAGNTLANKTLGLTLADGKRAVETSLAVPEAFAAKAEQENEAAEEAPLAWFILLALVGGVLLNFMPCVLPVLAIKLMSLLKGHESRAAMRKSFLATIVGILLSFMVLAGFAILAKKAGEVVGWGFHFQQPLFLIGLTLVMVLFASKLWDLYEVCLPSALATKLAHSSGQGGVAGDIASGAFATLLATPCSAPILGTAIGFALSRGAFEIVVIFLSLGVGLSLPYLLGIAFPGLMHLLPKPGRWMDKLKFLMGAFLAGTAVWLLWILLQQVDVLATMIVLGLSLLIVAVLAVTRKKAGNRPGAIIVVLLLAAGAFATPYLTSAHSQEVVQEAMWQEFDTDKIPALVAEGKIVVVDVTAKWCLTCQANELFVWKSSEVAAALGGKNVVAMRADWTLPNPAINEYLASFGRYGIPFGVVYGPGIPEGKVLPELLSKAIVLETIEAGQKSK